MQVLSILSRTNITGSLNSRKLRESFYDVMQNKLYEKIVIKKETVV